MAGKTSPLRHVINAVIGLALTALLAVLCLQIYRVATGQTATYGRDEAVAEQVKKQTKPTSDAPVKYADTAEVQAIIGTPEVKPEDLGGSSDSVFFRAPGGQVACLIGKDVGAVDTQGWIPLPADNAGNNASGAGAICVGIANLALHQEDVRRCPAGQSLRSSVVGIWEGGHGVGVCSPDLTKFNADARNHTEGGDRFDIPELNYATHVRVGDYGCTISGAQATCAQLSTGRAFTFEDNVGYELLN